MPILRFGILGTGNIARQFAEGVGSSGRRCAISAVGSRRTETATTFAAAHNIARSHGFYADLLKDETVDAVYVSLPNSLHHEWTMRSLEAGKHVLCEKPLAMDHAQASEMFAMARKHDRLLVEAFMYRSHPLYGAIKQVVDEGAIGDLKIIRTSFCYRTTRADNIRFDRTLGGGSLMDVGCYCINFSCLFAGGPPDKISASGNLHPTHGVDEAIACEMRFGSRQVATFSCAMSVHADNAAYLCGTEGYMIIPIPWKPPALGAQFTIARSTPPRMDLAAGAKAAPPEVRTVDAKQDLYALEADHFAETIFEGRAAAVREDESLANMQILDEIRRQIDLRW